MANTRRSGPPSSPLRAGLDALAQALYDRRPTEDDGLVHHSDRGSPYLSIRDSERLAEAGIAPSVGSMGDRRDNAEAEAIHGLHKAEIIQRHGPWKTRHAVDLATLEWWVARFNHHRRMAAAGPCSTLRVRGKPPS